MNVYKSTETKMYHIHSLACKHVLFFYLIVFSSQVTMLRADTRARTQPNSSNTNDDHIS